MKRISLLVFLFLAARSAPLCAQPAFEKEILFGSNITPTSVAQSFDGSFYISGFFSKDGIDLSGSFPFLLKTDESGNVLWVHRSANDLADRNMLTPTGDSGIAMMAILVPNELHVLWFDKNDEVQQTVLIQPATIDNQTRLAVAETADRGIVMAYTRTLKTIITKVTGDGTQGWTQICLGPWQMNAAAVIPTADSAVIICSVTQEFSTQNRIILTKFSPFGKQLWQIVDSNAQFLLSSFGAAKTSDGGFVLCGKFSTVNPLVTSNIYAAKFNGDGQFLWSTNLDIFGSQKATGITELASGDIAIAGTLSRSGDIRDLPLDGEPVIAILSSGGDIKGLKLLNTLPDFPANGIAIAPTRDGGFACIGAIANSKPDSVRDVIPAALFLIKSDESSIDMCHFENSLFTNGSPWVSPSRKLRMIRFSILPLTG